jgi:large subunit ribosomal protein L29
MKRKEKLNEYRGESEEQLALNLNDLEKNLFHLRFQSATDRLETPSEIRKVRKDIARILTIQGQRRRAAAQPTQPKKGAGK